MNPEPPDTPDARSTTLALIVVHNETFKATLRAGCVWKKDESATRLGVGADYFLTPTTSIYGNVSKPGGKVSATTAALTAPNREPRVETGIRHRF
ncbi:hypothetical protein ACWA7J_17645 [Leptothrix sp. BB-4]